MRLVVTSDLHYNVLRSRQPTLGIAEEICRLHADVLLILGDAAGQDVSILRECLQLFDRFPGRKLFVPGNHDIWAPPGESSLIRYEELLPRVCSEAGFHMLDLEPVVLGRIGLVGSMGWYDFSFRPEQLGIPLRFYHEKIAPGAAARMERYSHLLEPDDDIPEPSLRLGTRWMDGEHVRVPMSDVEFCERLLRRLDGQIAEIAPACDTIVAGLHHLPFAELVPPNANPSWAFAAAFLGSRACGEMLLGHPKVRHVYCGHAHMEGRLTRGQLTCTSTGCTYLAKRYELLEL